MTDLHKELAQAQTTQQVADALGIKTTKLLAVVNGEASLTPPRLGRQYVWTQDAIGAVRAHLEGVAARKERIAAAKKDGLCLHCGGSPFDPDGANEDTPQPSGDTADVVQGDGGGPVTP